MRIAVLIGLVVCVFSGCIKQDQGCTPVKPQDEAAQIMAYAHANSMNVIKHTSGIYYETINQGIGATPTMSSTITVSYTGKLLNDNIFEQNMGYTKALNTVIEGWQIGMPLIRKGGRIKLIIPSSYGYGCIEKGNIPPNSVLYYDIYLADVQ
jgi:FKBP-type peptidyl-prolyl cis-trans isomerase